MTLYPNAHYLDSVLQILALKMIDPTLSPLIHTNARGYTPPSILYMPSA